MSEKPGEAAEDITSRLIQTRLRELFEARDEARPPYTETEVARALTARGHKITAEGIRNLLRAERVNPKATTLRALAEFFKVPAGHLLGDDEHETASRQAKVMARSFDELSPQSRASLARVIREFLKVDKAARGDTDDHTPHDRQQ
ncbi:MULTISPECIES: hypothetical protein [unclassified Micromonospora]|uniref:hypothetical protein n=1 Tax=unclassified Micromonospora TaxID=2617518 RepID=UPI001C226E7B|nr:MULTISPECIES: hypothetical protein [unclassified Micromonospora]MBU8857792.1 hypothetical protein [Micromonospora sp. WMMB482]MDM4783423.1 hypothetical protein [Micromonospora sp. b486]